MRKSLPILILLFVSTIITAQVTGVSYMLDFDYQNGDTLYYDCNVRINSGSATTISERVQFNSQFSIVAPTGVAVKVVENYMPLKNNATYTGTEPIDWQNGTIVSNDPAFPNFDFISITPYIDLATYHYNDLFAGDIIKLFRISVIGEINCPLDLRIYENGVDPTSSDLAGGTDFSNSFTLGSPNQIYSDNFYSDDYGDDIEITLDNAVTCVGEPATLALNLICAPSDLSYAWSTGEITPSITVYNEGSQEYSVTITGPNSFSQVLTAEVNNLHSFLSNANDNELCIGGTIDLKLDNGIWISSNSDTLSINADGEITGYISGSSTVTYTDNDNGCSGQAEFTILDELPISITGPDEICIGETTTLSSGGEAGTWVSSDPTIGTITNAGLVTGLNAGQVTFVFTSNETLCQSSPSEPITVFPPATITLNETQICPGETTFATSSAFGGTWNSDNNVVATINSFTGEITAISHGCVTFTFTEGLNGCLSISEQLCVNPDIQVSIIGSDQICVGGTTQLSPSSGGLWTSADNLVAIVDNSGLVTGIGLGTTTFTFQDTVNYCADGTTETVTVGNIQGIANLGSDEVCIGTTTQLSPNTGGNWTSSNSAVAYSNNTGVVTGVGTGTAKLIFTTDLEDCEVVDEDIDIVVNELPTIELTGPSSICRGGTTIILFTGTLKKVENNNTTYTNSGVITGIYEGVTRYYSINGFGCSSDTVEITVIDTINPVLTGPSEICVGGYTSVSPNTGVTWTSNDSNVATVDNNGNVIGVGIGEVLLTVHDLTTGCFSETSQVITVVDKPTVSIEEIYICEGNETQASPSSGGAWVSSDTSIATINNNGVIVGLAPGVVQFNYVPSNITLCISDSLELTVLPTPTLITQQTEICFGDSLFVQLAGTTSLNILGPNGYTSSPSTTTGSIIINFPSPGTYILTPIDEFSSGCLPEQTIIIVYNTPIIEAASNPTIFIGDTLEIFSPDFIGLLISQYESIAFPISSQSIVGLSEGVTSITAVSEDGCFSNTIQVTVLSMNPCQGLDTTDQSYLLGTAYIDNNSNNTYDAGDAPLRNVVVSTEPGNFSILTDDLGNYVLPVIDGSYTLTAKINEGSWIEDLISIENIQISDPCNDGYDFGFVPIPTAVETATLSMVNSIARCDWETNFSITVENTGAEPFDGVLAFTYDDKTTLFTTDLLDFQVDGNTITSELGSLPPFTPKTYRVTVKMPGGSSNLPMLAFEAKLYNQSGELIEEYGYSDQLRCSYDPNDKREYPDREGDDNLTLMDEDLEYTIRFQNNGNDTAFQVKIVDPLDPSIDPSTIRVMNASHPVETCIEGTDLVFLFEDILLVDSMTNYAASQGFVTFRCNAKEGVAEFTPAHNQADIIFDTNPPIVTNETTNTLVSDLCTDKETILVVEICEGETYEGYAESGTYTESFALPFGCDSVVTIVLDVQGITIAQNTVDICTGESIFFNGVSYDIAESTEIVDTVMNANGCISEILSLQVNVTQINFSEENITICEGAEININGEIYLLSESTEIIDSIIDANGCIVDIKSYLIDVLPITYEQFDTTICEGFDYEGLTVTGSYTIDSFDLATGCQLEYTINLDVLPSSDPACTVGTTDFDENIVKLFPNPATESIFIETEELWESIRIMDTQGKIVSSVSQVEIGKLEVNVSQYASGVYMILFKTGDKNLTKRFVVK